MFKKCKQKEGLKTIKHFESITLDFLPLNYTGASCRGKFSELGSTTRNVLERKLNLEAIEVRFSN